MISTRRPSAPRTVRLILLTACAKTFNGQKRLPTLFRPLAKLVEIAIGILLFLTLSSNLSAQQSTTSITDGTTPSGIAAGSPTGSYALSGFENINLFNGNLNF